MPAVPIGGILHWSGSLGTIPAGYHLCNGLDGTVDLRDRFVPCAGGSLAVDATGGAAGYAIPAHHHDPGTTITSIDPGWPDKKTYFEDRLIDPDEIEEHARHTHPFPTGTQHTELTISSGFTVPNLFSSFAQPAGAHAHGLGGWVGENPIFGVNEHQTEDHRHTLTGTYADASVAGGASQLPPFYALYFIQRIS